MAELSEMDRVDLRRLAADLVLAHDFDPALVVAKAADLVAGGVDGSATLELASLPAEPKALDRWEVERLFRATLMEHGIEVLPADLAGWEKARWIAALIVDGAIKPAAGASRLWALWRDIRAPKGELAEMLQLFETWEVSVGDDHEAAERAIVDFAPQVIAAAERQLATG